MKTIAIHSHKGGVGKTTIALLLAKHAAMSGRTVCVIDFDFIGTGIADLFALERVPNTYLEQYILGADPAEFDVKQLLGYYTDRDMPQSRLRVILSEGKGMPRQRDRRAVRQREDDLLGLVADEPHYHEVGTKTKILFDRLTEADVELVVLDCHPGLGLVSDTMRPTADLNVFVTTPNRADCFGVLKEMNLRKLDGPRSFLILNRADSAVESLAAFRRLVEQDPLVGAEAKTLFPQLKYVGQNEGHFCAIPQSDLLRRAFYLGGRGHLPRIEPKQGEFRFLDKALSLV